MRKILIAAALVGSMTQARAADIPITVSDQERAVILLMCEHAKWAARMTFDGACEYWKAKLDAAEKAAPKPDAPAQPKE